MSETQQLEEICAKVEALEQSAVNLNKLMADSLFGNYRNHCFLCIYVTSSSKLLLNRNNTSMAMDIIVEKIPSNDAMLSGVEDLAIANENALQLDQKIPEVNSSLQQQTKTLL